MQTNNLLRFSVILFACSILISGLILGAARQSANASGLGLYDSNPQETSTVYAQDYNDLKQRINAKIDRDKGIIQQEGSSSSVDHSPLQEKIAKNQGRLASIERAQKAEVPFRETHSDLMEEKYLKNKSSYAALKNDPEQATNAGIRKERMNTIASHQMGLVDAEYQKGFNARNAKYLGRADSHQNKANSSNSSLLAKRFHQWRANVNKKNAASLQARRTQYFNRANSVSKRKQYISVRRQVGLNRAMNRLM